MINALPGTRDQAGVSQPIVGRDGELTDSYLQASSAEQAGQFDPNQPIEMYKASIPGANFDRILQTLQRVVTDSTKEIIQRMDPMAVHFEPLRVRSNKTGEERDLWYMFFRAVIDCIPGRSPNFNIKFARRYIVNDLRVQPSFWNHFFEYSKVKNRHIWRIQGSSDRFYFSNELSDQLRAAGMRYAYREEGYAFSDGTGWHPQLLPEWPPRELPLPNELPDYEQNRALQSHWRRHPLNPETGDKHIFYMQHRRTGQ